MALPNIAQVRKIASYKPMAFRPAHAPRPFRRGDLALVLGGGDPSFVGQMVVVCMSDRGNDGRDPEIAVRFTRGSSGHVRASSLQLIAAVDAHEYGPACDDLLNFIAGCGPVGLADLQ
ncbi:hypothetical protein LJR130_003064 [Variovorax sp. LjRoot130]|uniref:hypothetical protein n=1 Tax=Variovorax sp. LjRoot130 TaxID=3342261 RepID=UPI003ECF1F96